MAFKACGKGVGVFLVLQPIIQAAIDVIVEFIPTIDGVEIVGLLGNQGFLLRVIA